MTFLEPPYIKTANSTIKTIYNFCCKAFYKSVRVTDRILQYICISMSCFIDLFYLMLLNMRYDLLMGLYTWAGNCLLGKRWSTYCKLINSWAVNNLTDQHSQLMFVCASVHSHYCRQHILYLHGKMCCLQMMIFSAA